MWVHYRYYRYTLIMRHHTDWVQRLCTTCSSHNRCYVFCDQMWYAFCISWNAFTQLSLNQDLSFDFCRISEVIALLSLRLGSDFYRHHSSYDEKYNHQNKANLLCRLHTKIKDYFLPSSWMSLIEDKRQSNNESFWLGFCYILKI